MGWSNYMYFKKLNIALEIGKFGHNDYLEDAWRTTEQFVEYMSNTEEPDLEVIKYLWDRTYVFNTIDMMFNILMDYYKDQDPEIITETELQKLKNVKVLIR